MSVIKIGFNLFDSKWLEPELALDRDLTFVGFAIRGIWRSAHRYVNIFENLPRGDAENSVGGLNQVIAFASAVLSAEMVGEAEVRAELFGFDKKAGAVGFPLH
jgi:hypothetical protein